MNGETDQTLDGYLLLLARQGSRPAFDRLVRRWMNIFGWIVGFLLFAVAVYCAWRFFAAADSPAMFRWGVGMTIATLALGLVKLWLWMELHTHLVIRQVKRAERQIARLTTALQARGD